MKTGDLKNIQIAKKYANALFQSALESDKTEKIYSELSFIDETLKINKELFSFLTSPLIRIEDKKDVIEKLFSIHTDKIMLDFLYILTEASRIDAIEEITNKYSQLYDKKRNIIKPVIISAVELDELQKNSIQTKLEAKLQKTVIPQYSINSDIIGGLIIEINDKTIDCSLKTKFDNMKKELIKGN